MPSLLLASFNYYGPSTTALSLGLVVAAFVLIGLWFIRSIVAGILAGAASGAAIAWFVFGTGRGDMVGLMQDFGACVFGVAGAILGGLAGLGGRLVRRKTGRNSSARPGL